MSLEAFLICSMHMFIFFSKEWYQYVLHTAVNVILTNCMTKKRLCLFVHFMCRTHESAYAHQKLSAFGARKLFCIFNTTALLSTKLPSCPPTPPKYLGMKVRFQLGSMDNCDYSTIVQYIFHGLYSVLSTNVASFCWFILYTFIPIRNHSEVEMGTNYLF